jgi:energy-coupling factor transporter ATP-binding protein EcfA2
MDAFVDELTSWFKDRPGWLRDAARRLIQNDNISDQDIFELTLLCKKEAGICVDKDEDVERTSIPEGSLYKSSSANKIHLMSISSVKGINALNPRKPLEFGENNLTIIYGSTGSGKSGYVRVLKHACGAKNIGKLHRNVFSSSDSIQGCKFQYKINGNIKKVDWIANDGIYNDLSSIEVYDAYCADIYISKESELTYEPGVLSFFKILIDVCDNIKVNLNNEITSQVSRKPQLPLKFNDTSGENQWCNWSDQYKETYKNLQERLAEPDPKAKAVLLEKQKENIIILMESIIDYLISLSTSNCKKYLSKKNEDVVRRKAADDSAKKLFKDAPLDGVGTESWKLLWEQARRYSEEWVYKNINFPNTKKGARCVLCQQPLDLEKEAIPRITSFENFIKGGLEKDAVAAENNYKILHENLCNIPAESDFTLLLDACDIGGFVLRQDLINYRDKLEKRKLKLIDADIGDEFDELNYDDLINCLNEKAESKVVLARTYKKDSEKKDINCLEKKMVELEAKKWLSEQRESIGEEISRLQTINKLKKAIKLTDTTLLSKKKSSLADSLITDAYIVRFNNELKELGAQKINVELKKTRTDKGRVLHQLKIMNNNSGIPTSEILSEGEYRIVSLSIFLADVEGSENTSTFVFDDPISSLDQDYEEATAKRLVELSKKRQVLVFTHRLSIIASIENHAKKLGFEPNVIGLEAEPWGTGEPREAPLPAQKPKNAINTLIDRVARARKILNDVGKTEYEIQAKSICSDFRITIERLVELELLADVVQRFRRDVHTKNKLVKVSKITHDDCSYIDNLMGKYSAFEHSQPKEAPISLPDPETLETDLVNLKDWLEKFSQRQH